MKIGACFIAGIILVSLLSRLARAFELRVTDVRLDGMAERFVRDVASRKVRFIANEPDRRDEAEYRDKVRQIRTDNDIPAEDDLVFVEVTVLDPSEFETALTVRGQVMHGRYRVLTVESSSIPNALAALLLHVRDTTGCTPHIYFEWTEGNPFANFLRFFLFGQGEVAPVTREVLREAEPDRAAAAAGARGLSACAGAAGYGWKRYPSPGSVIRWRGADGSGSSFCRRPAM